MQYVAPQTLLLLGKVLQYADRLRMLIIGTPKIITIIDLNMEQFDFTKQQIIPKMQVDWQQCRP